MIFVIIFDIVVFGLMVCFCISSMLTTNFIKTGIHNCFISPSSPVLFYIVQFTWGLPMNIIGAFMALGLLIIRAKKYKFGYGVAWELPGIDWGLSVGMFMIVPENTMEKDVSMIEHEYGHAIQNYYLGLAMPFVVFFPSIIRFWYRRIKANIFHKENKTGYLDIWFERSASDSGRFFNEQAQ